MPGVLLLESMAQVGGLLLLNSEDDLSTKLVMLLGANNVKFRKPVIPGDQLIMKVRLVNRRMNIVGFEAKCYVNDVLVTEAEIRAAIVDRATI
jgi:3-hydroxyacyl-[acyl-carrier-protein] dehydratase